MQALPEAAAPEKGTGRAMTTATRFAAGAIGREPTPAQKLERLQAEVRMKQTVHAAHRCHGCEIELARAAQAVDDFLAAHPELA